MSTKKLNAKKLQRMVMTAVLAAIIVVLMISGLGYIPIGPGLTLTVLSIPMAVGAILLGPAAGAVLGAVFGVTSYATCFLGMDAFGVALVGISPVKTFLVCVPTRILAGLLCGLIFKALDSVDSTHFFSYAAASLSASALNTILFLLVLWLLFRNDPFILQYTNGSVSVWAIFLFLGGINSVIESAGCLVLGTAITKSVAAAFKNRL